MSPELVDLCRYYNGVPITVMSARYSFVVAVQSGERSLVMRATPDPGGENQAKVAHVLAELGIGPTIHEVISTETGTWIVMDRVWPGTSLRETPTTNRTVSALAALLQPLRGQPTPPPGLPHIKTWLRERLEDDELSDRAPGRNIASRAQRERALAVLTDLNDKPAGLCHGDASYGNILHAEKGRLLFIDPRGMSGDPAYDAAVVALKSAHYLAPPKVADTLATSLHLDSAQIRAWMFVADTARV